MKSLSDTSEVISGQSFTFWGLTFLDKFSLMAEAILKKKAEETGALKCPKETWVYPSLNAFG